MIGFLSLFNVPIDSEALVLRGDEVHRKLGPGYQTRIPVLETVIIEAVPRERFFRHDELFVVQGCQTEVSLAHRIGELEEYYTSGGDLAALRELRPRLAGALASLTDLSEMTETAASFQAQVGIHLQPLTGPVPGGFLVIRINARIEDCCEPKRVMQETALASVRLETLGFLSPEHVSLGAENARTFDGIELQATNAIATHEVADEARLMTCFRRRRDTVPLRTRSAVATALRKSIQTIPIDRVTGVPAMMPDFYPSLELELFGQVFGTVDFSAAKLSRRIVVNCDETEVEGGDASGLADPTLRWP